MAPNLMLQVGGNRYGGWRRIRVLRGIEAIAGGFELEVSERWGEGDLWPIAEEDECAVWVDGVSVISGYVDKRAVSFGPGEHTLQIAGRDKAAALVDCSAVLKSWEFFGTPLLSLAQKLAEPFGISVTMDPGVDPKAVQLTVGNHAGSVAAAGGAGRNKGTALPKPMSKFSIDPGESAWDVLDRACRMSGVLPVSDGFGGVLLTRAGTSRCPTPIGDNVLSGSATFEASGRYRTYIVSAQQPGSEESFGLEAVSVRGTATDPNVRRAERVLMIRPEASATIETAKTRAQWEAKVRAARGDSVNVTLQGWTTSDGNLWPINSLVATHIPLFGIDGDMLITQAVHTIDLDTGVLTQLTLRRPDAFLPEPVVSLSGFWKEIAGGVK